IMSVAGNYIEYGPNTVRSIAAGIFQGGDVDVYWNDNTIVSDFAASLFRGKANFIPAPAIWPQGLYPLPSKEVKAHVLANAGAFFWDRDTIDDRIVVGVRNGTG